MIFLELSDEVMATLSLLLTQSFEFCQFLHFQLFVNIIKEQKLLIIKLI